MSEFQPENFSVLLVQDQALEKENSATSGKDPGQLRDCLVKAGFSKVDTLSCLREAERVLQENSNRSAYDAVILQQCLEDSGGSSGAGALRKILQDEPVSLILNLTSGKKNVPDYQNIFQLGVDELLTPEQSRGEKVARVLQSIQVRRAMAQAQTRSRDLEASNERLRVLASIDELTGLYNARYFNIALGDQWQWSREKQKSLALLLLDLDFFKQVNDRYSHLTGNEVLAAISGRILHSIRQSTDLAARFGGEEFAIILPGANVIQAAKIAENIRQNIAKSPIKTETLRNETIPMTTSIGVVATVADQNETIPDTEAFIHQADEALYQAKQDGRDCVRISKNSLRPSEDEHPSDFLQWGGERMGMDELPKAAKS